MEILVWTGRFRRRKVCCRVLCLPTGYWGSRLPQLYESIPFVLQGPPCHSIQWQMRKKSPLQRFLVYDSPDKPWKIDLRCPAVQLLFVADSSLRLRLCGGLLRLSLWTWIRRRGGGDANVASWLSLGILPLGSDMFIRKVWFVESRTISSTVKCRVCLCWRLRRDFEQSPLHTEGDKNSNVARKATTEKGCCLINNLIPTS